MLHVIVQFTHIEGNRSVKSHATIRICMNHTKTTQKKHNLHMFTLVAFRCTIYMIRIMYICELRIGEYNTSSLLALEDNERNGLIINETDV